MADITKVSTITKQVMAEVERAVVGKRPLLEMMMASVLAGGHILLEDFPGLGKTLIARSFARALGLEFKRIQFTPDLLPGDITGGYIFNRTKNKFELRKGPVFANIILADEINRATPKTQAALLEAMEERQVSVDGVTRALPLPFFVVATQNPHDHAGTFPLVEGQRDRFALVTTMGYPDRASEKGLLLGRGGGPSLRDLAAVTNADAVSAAIAATATLRVAATVADYVLDIASATRAHPDVALGASTRASLWLVRTARAHAVLCGRDYVSPADVQAVAAPVLAHRLLLGGGADTRAATALVTRILEQLPVPSE